MENQGPTGGLTPHIAIADKRAGVACACRMVRICAWVGVRFLGAASCHALLLSAIPSFANPADSCRAMGEAGESVSE